MRWQIREGRPRASKARSAVHLLESWLVVVSTLQKGACIVWILYVKVPLAREMKMPSRLSEY